MSSLKLFGLCSIYLLIITYAKSIIGKASRTMVVDSLASVIIERMHMRKP